MKFAAVTICKNEEHNVAQWLKYTKDFDYRIVLDTGSTDKTISLFKKADVLLYEKIFDPFNFSKARNYILSLVPSDVDWIIWPDLDEYYVNWKNPLEKAIANDSTITRILYPNIIYKDGILEPAEETGTVMDCKIHKANMYKWIKPIHEHLVSISDIDKNFYITDIIRYHYQISSMVRNDLYFTIALTGVKDDPTDEWNVWFVLNESYERADADSVIKYGNMYLDLTKPYTDFRSMALLYIAMALVQLNGVNDFVILLLLRSVSEDPNNKRAKELYTSVTGNLI